MAKNRYVGHRYIPIFENGWDKTRTYEPLTFVYYEGKTYVSRQLVPTNIEIENNDFWAFFMDNAPQIFTPKFTGQWEDKPYEPLSIVVNNGNTYVSKQNVPVGTLLTDETYWLDLSNYYNQLFTDYENAEQERQQAEQVRIENENQRNLTSVDEFTKLQNSIGGRNYLLNSNKPNALTFATNNSTTMPLIIGVENGVDYLQQSLNGEFNLSTFINTGYSNSLGVRFSEDLSKYSGLLTLSVDVKSNVPLIIRMEKGNKVSIESDKWTRLSVTISNQLGRPLGLVASSSDNPNTPPENKVYWRNYKIEKSTQPTPYTKAPEDYTTVSKTDYYNHIELVNNAKNNQFNQLKQAVIALGGTI